MPPNGPILQRTIAALDRMRSGYSHRPSIDGRHMVFIHRRREPFTLPTGPELTFGQALATIGERVDVNEFLSHYRPDEEF